MLMCSANVLVKMMVAELAQMSHFYLFKSDAMWPMAQMATGKFKCYVHVLHHEGT